MLFSLVASKNFPHTCHDLYPQSQYGFAKIIRLVLLIPMKFSHLFPPLFAHRAIMTGHSIHRDDAASLTSQRSAGRHATTPATLRGKCRTFCAGFDPQLSIPALVGGHRPRNIQAGHPHARGEIIEDLAAKWRLDALGVASRSEAATSPQRLCLRSSHLDMDYTPSCDRESSTLRWSSGEWQRTPWRCSAANELMAVVEREALRASSIHVRFARGGI